MNTEPLVTTPESASAMFDHGQCVLVDVRTPVEFASTHVPGSLNIPLDRLSKEFVETHPDLSGKNPWFSYASRVNEPLLQPISCIRIMRFTRLLLKGGSING